MRLIRLINRGIRDAFKSVFRNFSLSIAAIFCVIVTLLLVSASIIISTNVNYFTKQVESSLTVVVFMQKDATSEDITNLDKEIKALPNIDTYRFKSKEEIKNDMSSESDAFKNAMEEWTPETNPLKNSLLVKVKDINKIKDTVDKIKSFKEVSTVQYGEGMVENLVSIFSFIEKITIGIVISLILVSSFLISNTIKITIFSRKTEIDIMRLVGTSNFYIKFPHIVEGFIVGVLGSIIPVLATIYGYVYLYTANNGVFMINMFKLISPYNFVYRISLILIGIGAVVGMLGSYRAVRKHLTI